MTGLFLLLGLLGAGLAAGFAGGVFGIGGGFVVVPALLVMLPLLGGDTIAICPCRDRHLGGDDHRHLDPLVTSHAKRGSVDFEILKTWAPWIVLGDGCGVLLASHVNGQVLTADLRDRRRC